MNDYRMLLAIRFADTLADSTPLDNAVTFAAHHYGIAPDALRTAWIADLMKKYLLERRALDRAPSASQS